MMYRTPVQDPVLGMQSAPAPSYDLARLSRVPLVQEVREVVKPVERKQVEYHTIIREQPRVETVEKRVEVPQIEVREVVEEVPQVVIQETIVEVPDVQQAEIVKQVPR